LRSSSYRRLILGQPDRSKRRNTQDNGCRLGRLIDLQGQQVAIYRRDRPVEILTAPEELLGEDMLPGFVLDARFLWQG